MAEIGRGAQYRVDRISEGRVRKTPLSPEESSAVIASWGDSDETLALDRAVGYLDIAYRSFQKVGQLVRDYPEVAYSFGSPVFEGDGSYTQNEVSPLRNVLAQSSTAEGQDIIDSYVDLVRLHWTYGISERGFNFSVNNGIDVDGRVVLFDFGELLDGRDEASSTVASRKWLNMYSYTRLPETLQGYYADRMAENVTLGALSELWAARLAPTSGG